MGLVSAEVQKEFDRLKERIEQLQTMLGKVAAFIQPGTPVWYESSPLRRYAAVVDSVPREIGGDGQWCVRLRDLDEAYQQSHTTNRTTVLAAATWCLTPREVDEVPWKTQVEAVYDALGTLSLTPQLDRETWAALCHLQSDLAVVLGRAVPTIPAPEPNGEHPFPGLGTQIQTREDRPGEIRIVPAQRPDDDTSRESWRASIRDVLAANKQSAAADFDARRFVECAECRRKPGSPTLCSGCLANRQTIAELKEQLEDKTCARHAGQIHGEEAEELRKGIECVLAEVPKLRPCVHVDRCAMLLQRLLDDVDARDSLAYLESKDRIFRDERARGAVDPTADLRKAERILAETTLSTNRLVAAASHLLLATPRSRLNDLWQEKFHQLVGSPPPPKGTKRHRFALARSIAGLSIGQAARLLNVDRSILTAIEDAADPPLPEVVEKLADLYRVNTSWLLGETPRYDYSVVDGMSGADKLTQTDRNIIAEFAAAMPRKVTPEAQALRDRVRGKKED